jgi:hypothetical protein
MMIYIPVQLGCQYMTCSAHLQFLLTLTHSLITFSTEGKNVYEDKEYIQLCEKIVYYKYIKLKKN